jgi:hypothetical protein
MSFTVWGLGVVLVAIGILLLKGLRGIFSAFIFTAPLFITTVLLFPITVLRTSYFFALIFITGVLIKRVTNRKHIKKKVGLKKDLLPIFVFLFIITISLMMPFFFKNIQVIGFDSSVGLVDTISYEKLSFQLSNITQLIYPYFQGILFVVIAAYLNNESKILKTSRLLIKSSFLVLITGSVYLLFGTIGNTNFLKGIDFVITGVENFRLLANGGILGLPRMSSWAGEPGYTSFLFLAILGLLVGQVITKNYVIFNKKQTIWAIVLFVIGTIITTGTTGYIGLIILFLLACVGRLGLNNVATKAKLRGFFIPLIGIFLFVIFLKLFAGFSFLEYFVKQHLDKITELSGSGLVRYEITQNSIQHFLLSPILGIGYGSERSLALSTFLLGNTGLLGFLSFMFWGLSLLKKMWNILKNKFATHKQKTLAIGFFISFGTMFILMQFAKSESSLLFQYFWIIGACMLSTHRDFKKRKAHLTG